MKSVLISIQPKWCELIASGKKTIEVRKTKPKLETPFKVYIYCTYGQGLIKNNDLCYPNMLLDQKVSKNAIWGNCCNGKVIGEFVCDKLVWVVSHPSIFAGHDLLHKAAIESACLTTDEAEKYANGKDVYGWHISNLVIYDKPRELREFIKPCENGLYCESCAMYSEFEEKCYNKALRIKTPPQSWCYVEKG